ncbi:MAG: AraC family transcriptional regulator [Treponema sp.]|nr:AraC family transcriptional regulator [Treponema sp.]
MLQYIDANIKEKLNIEKLAARAGFSPYHFCRVFQWGVGYSIMEYVRNRRLFYAASEFASGRRIADIAADYGFETHSGFSKAFRRYFGCPPEKYREHASFDIPKLPILERTKKYVSGGIVMEPKMVKKSSVKLAGFTLKTMTRDRENIREIPKFWDAYMTDGRMEKLYGETFLESHAEYGVCFSEDPENGDMVYVIGVEVKEGRSVPGGYHICTVPEALYAVFTTPPADESNFAPSIQGTWDYIYSEWFPDSGYEFDSGGLDFELYDERCRDTTGKIIDIYIPVVEL